MPRKTFHNKPATTLIGQLRADEFYRLRSAFQAHLETWLERHDTGASTEEISAAFIAENPALLEDFARSFTADLARQRSLW